MEPALDLTELFNTAPASPAETALKSVLIIDGKKEQTKCKQRPQRRYIAPPELAPELSNAYKREKDKKKRTLEIYREYQDNMRAAGSLRTDIIKGAKAGEDTACLLLKAADCIGRMTGDKLFYTLIAGEITKRK